MNTTGYAPVLSVLMLQIYDQLLREAHSTASIVRAEFGTKWCLVETDTRAGLALAYPPYPLDESSPFPVADSFELATSFIGKPLHVLQEQILSPHSAIASLAMAAINCALNQSSGHQLNLNPPMDLMPRLKQAASQQELIAVGAFPFLRKLEVEVPILERRAKAGNLPDWACYTELPRYKFVLITAASLLNKTLPSLISICQSQAILYLMGPTAPFSKSLLQAGIQRICGLEVYRGLPAELLGASRGLFDSPLAQKWDLTPGSNPDTNQ